VRARQSGIRALARFAHFLKRDLSEKISKQCDCSKKILLLFAAAVIANVNWTLALGAGAVVEQ